MPGMVCNGTTGGYEMLTYIGLLFLQMYQESFAEALLRLQIAQLHH